MNPAASSLSEALGQLPLGLEETTGWSGRSLRMRLNPSRDGWQAAGNMFNPDDGDWTKTTTWVTGYMWHYCNERYEHHDLLFSCFGCIFGEHA